MSVYEMSYYMNSLPSLSADYVVYGGHILLVSFWSAVIFAYVSIRTSSSFSLPSTKHKMVADSRNWSSSINDDTDIDTETKTETETDTERRMGEVVSISKPLVLSSSNESTEAQERLRYVYVVGYLWMMAGDWLQGPYVYQLYASYGYNGVDIGLLFVAGFASSALCGTLVASLADTYGRKNFTLIYALIYSAACLTKHWSNFSVLLIGRILGGIATSILFSAFESWIIAMSRKDVNKTYQAVSERENDLEDNQRDSAAARPTSSSWLSLTFSIAGQGNSMIAILSGLVGEMGNQFGGPTVPFDLAIICLAIGAIFIAMTWENDYIAIQQQSNDPQQDQQQRQNKSSIWSNAASMCNSPAVLVVGVIQACFESSMYVFIFMWSPALASVIEAEASTGRPFLIHRVFHGWVFASFMICAWCGSYLFAYAVSHARLSFERLGFLTMTTAAFSLALVPITTDLYSRLVLFSGFELCVGAFWPYIACLREKYIVDDSVRSTCMTLYRIPLNLVVMGVLLNIDHLTEATLFHLCSVGLVLAAAANVLLLRLSDVNEI